MGSSSDEESEISDSDIPSYKEKAFEELKSGKYRVKLTDEFYRCPFCLGKKKQQHDYKSLMQHATGVGKGSANRKAKQKANHLALATYMEEYLPNEAYIAFKKTCGPPGKKIKVEKDEQKSSANPPENTDQFVWPWTGIIVNFLSKPRDGDEHYIKKEFARFRPTRVQTMWNSEKKIGYAVLDFSRDWAGFRDAMAFEKDYEERSHGRKYWNKRKSDPGSRRYGWFARAEDYNCDNMIGEYLRANGELKTIHDIVDEASQKRQDKLATLTGEIDAKNEDLNEWQSKYNETSRSLDRLMDEKEKIQQAYNEEIKKLQRDARDRTQKVFFESEQMKRDLESRKRDIEHWSKQLNRREAFNELQRKQLEEEKNKSMMKNDSLEKASMEQKKADENVLRLVEDQKREKEAALNKILQLQKELNVKQKLELEIAELKGSLQVMKHMGGEDDKNIEEKMKEVDEKLTEKMEEMEGLEELNQTLMVKERKSNDELQDARKELIYGLRDILMTSRTLIFIKRMGELDEKPFQKACKLKYSGEEASIKAAELCSQWQDHLGKPEWHPFKVIEDGGQTKEIINEGDEKLVDLRKDLGDEACEAVITALKELNEYNPSGRYIVPEMWHSREKRKATLKEVINWILRSLKTCKRKRDF
ncbi:hypothetical protein ACHQM5_029864 [Ranunculus cassubicifolius]